jgi:hypothetical protein
MVSLYRDKMCLGFSKANSDAVTVACGEDNSSETPYADGT